jgi:methylmalonyl-CoA mutase
LEPVADRLFLVPASKYAEIGASATTELAIALSWAHEYLVELLQNDVLPTRAAQLIEIELASGTDFFTEIAKFRAIRVLWSILTSKYEIESPTLHLSSINSRWYFTKNDEHTNLLRATTQTMSGIIGGSQTLTVLPFNGAGDAFSERLAANVGNLLEQESYFKKLHDPSYGSHYLDDLTYQIVQLAWKRTAEIENVGGFSKAKNNGLIKKMYKDDADLESKKVVEGSKTLLGVNKFPNPNSPIIQSISVESLERAYFEAK